MLVQVIDPPKSDRKALTCQKMPEPAISLSSKFLIENESDIDTLLLLLQQKFKMPQEKLEQWRDKIAFEFRDNINY